MGPPPLREVDPDRVENLARVCTHKSIAYSQVPLVDWRRDLAVAKNRF